MRRYYMGQFKVGDIWISEDDANKWQVTGVTVGVSVVWITANRVMSDQKEKRTFAYDLYETRRLYEPVVACETTPCYDSDCECIYNDVR